MALSLIQFRANDGLRGVAAIANDETPRAVIDVSSVKALAEIAIADGIDLAEAVHKIGLGTTIDLDHVTLLSPIDHEDPAHLILTGTGLTHLGSAKGRDEMHRAAKTDEAMTDSMKMFLMGLEAGKPEAGKVGAQPEWFYKGNGHALVAPGAPLVSPTFALDAGEEPEIAGVYVIGKDGTPFRLGFALGNEFSDHITERGNYLWLAHSKLRQASIGPELYVGELPDEVVGTSRIIRDEKIIWERPFLSGEKNMSHTIANLQHHHFKYDIFRRPGDIHVHFYGTATLSFNDGIQAKPGDVFEITATPFSIPLRNPITISEEQAFAIRML